MLKETWEEYVKKGKFFHIDYSNQVPVGPLSASPLFGAEDPDREGLLKRLTDTVCWLVVQAASRGARPWISRAVIGWPKLSDPIEPDGFLISKTRTSPSEDPAMIAGLPAEYPVRSDSWSRHSRTGESNSLKVATRESRDLTTVRHGH